MLSGSETSAKMISTALLLLLVALVLKNCSGWLLLLCSVGLGVMYSVTLTVYRLYFHPLAAFPGPRAVAATRWVEFYHDVVGGGRFMWKLEEMHQKYGPIIRVSPDEVHIMDSHFYDDVYVRKKLDKYQSWCNLAAARSSILTTACHDLHRNRRGALNNFFARSSISRLESMIQDKVDKLYSRFQAMQGTNQLFRFDVAFMALASDIISEYAFETCYDYLDDKDFNVAWHDAIIAAVSTGALLRQFPFISSVIKNMPRIIIDRMPLKHFARIKRDMRAQIRDIMAKPQAERNRFTIFHALIDSNLPEEEKTLDRLTDEGQILYGAGSETTAKTLTVIAFHLLRNPAILKYLRHELDWAKCAAGGVQTLPLAQLEKLPYLKAVIYEGLRLAGGVTTRTPRISPNDQLQYGAHIIPAGTPVSQTAYFVLMDASIFPVPKHFDPERWFIASDVFQSMVPALSKHLVAFGRGTRACLGVNLAYAELYMTVATVFGGDMEFELGEGVGEEDVTVARDAFVGAAVEGRGEVWAKVLQ